MSNNGGIITRPVNQRDVQQVLGISSSVNKWSQLCTHIDINKWSKYKPNKYASNTIMSQYDYTHERWKDDSTWWKGVDGRCGFTPYSTSNLSNVITNTTGGMNGWTYDGVPTGGTYPYREADFIGYNHNAVPMLANFACPAEIKPNGNFFATCMVPLPDDNVTLGDIIVNGSALYFGVVITNSSGTIITQVTNDTAGVSGVTFTFPSRIGYGTGYRCYPFLSTNPIELDGSIGNNLFYTCPNLSYATFDVVSTYHNYDVGIDATYALQSHTAIEVSLTNNMSYDLPDCRVYILPYTTQNWNNPASAVSQAVASTNNFTLSAGVTSIKTFVVVEGNYFAYITLNNAAEYRKANIKEEIAPDPELLIQT